MKFLGLVVRCANEPYVREFVTYYLNEGVNEIHILDDKSEDSIYKGVELPNVFIHKNYRLDLIPNQRYNAYYPTIQHKFKWLIVCDMDEFITTKRTQGTIKQELETTFKDCDCIKIPWVMMSCGSIQKNPPSLLQTNIQRWNHNKTHTGSPYIKFGCRYYVMRVKCIFNPAKFNSITPHMPMHPISNDLIIVDGIENKQQLLNAGYNNLREHHIHIAHLACYHYRIVSVEQCLNKIKYNDMYKQYTLNDLLSYDFPELVDETLKIKSKLSGYIP